MDKELQRYYEARFLMFSEIGWKDLMEDIDKRIQAVESIKGVNDVETLWKHKGELECLEWLKSLPRISREVYEQLQAEDEDARGV